MVMFSKWYCIRIIDMIPWLVANFSVRVLLITSLVRHVFLMVIISMYENLKSILLPARAIINQDMKSTLVTVYNCNFNISHSICSVVGTSEELFPYQHLLQLNQYLTIIWIWGNCNNDVTNNPSFRQKRPDVLDGSGGSDWTSYPLTENYSLPVTQVTRCVAYLPPWLCAQDAVTYTHQQNDQCITLFAGAVVMM